MSDEAIQTLHSHRDRTYRRSSTCWAPSPACLVVLLCLVVIMCPGGVARAADGQEIAANGNSRGAPACATCHGPHGEGNADSGFPRLAGLNAAYLAHQLASFDDGTRQNETMQPIAKALTPDERDAVARYYSAATAPNLQADKPDEKLVAKGRGLADTGDWSKGLPGCGQCHGPVGQGVGTAFPALAGQVASYISRQVTAWKSKTRKNDPLGLMAGIASKLDETEISAVAAYYASLPAIPPADGKQQGAAR